MTVDERPLDYSSVRPLVSRRSRRYIFFIIASSFTIVLSIRVWSAVEPRIALLALQDRCLHHHPTTAPLNYLGFVEEDESIFSSVWTESWVESRVRVDSDWQRFSNQVAVARNRRATLMMHERITRSGTRRLVIVELERYPEMRFTAIALGTLFKRPTAVRKGVVSMDEETRIFLKGGLDVLPGPCIVEGAPEDGSGDRFKIPVYISGILEHLEGRLLDDNSVTVHLTDPAGARQRQRERSDLGTSNKSKVSG